MDAETGEQPVPGRSEATTPATKPTSPLAHAARTRADQLLLHFVERFNDGAPELCSYAWAYRELIGPYERWSQAYAKQVAELPRQTQRIRLADLGDVRLDTFIVAAESGIPSQGHWATAPYSREQWQRVLGSAPLRQ